MERHIGIYSGTFDPIHAGHIGFAKEAMKLCSLDEIVFLPELQPREKQNVTPIVERVALIQNAIEHEPSFSVMRLTSAQFTTNTTLPELQTAFQDASFTLLLGSDVVRTFSYRWKNLGTLLDQVSLAIGMRDGDTTEQLSIIIKNLEVTHDIKVDHTFVYTNHGHMASTRIRKSALT